MTGTTSLSLAGEAGEEGRARGESSKASEEEGVVATLAALRIEEAAENEEGEAWVVMAAAVMPGTRIGSCIASSTFFERSFIAPSKPIE